MFNHNSFSISIEGFGMLYLLISRVVMTYLQSFSLLSHHAIKAAIYFIQSVHFGFTRA